MELQNMAPWVSSAEAIDHADTPESLRQARIDSQKWLLASQASAPLSDWLRTANEMHDRIAARAVQMCEKGMVEDGFGPPPVPYAFIAFGSMGRSESTLWSDQDNGMIVSDIISADKELYFREFGCRVSAMLEYLGYPKCEGKVMCSEPLWRQTLSGWQEQLTKWSDDFAWEPIRHLIISSDMRHIAGDEQLSANWKRSFYELFRKHPDLSSAVLRNTVRHKATLNILGQIVTERFGEHAGDFDVKYGLYIPLVNAVRFLALQHGVEETSTLKRLRRLASLEAAPLPLLDACERAFRIALQLRMATPVKENAGLLVSNGYLAVKPLKQGKGWHELREALSTVRRLHRALQRQLRFMEGRRS